MVETLERSYSQRESTSATAAKRCDPLLKATRSFIGAYKKLNLISKEDAELLQCEVKALLRYSVASSCPLTTCNCNGSCLTTN